MGPCAPRALVAPARTRWRRGRRAAVGPRRHRRSEVRDPICASDGEELRKARRERGRCAGPRRGLAQEDGAASLRRSSRDVAFCGRGGVLGPTGLSRDQSGDPQASHPKASMALALRSGRARRRGDRHDPRHETSESDARDRRRHYGNVGRSDVHTEDVLPDDYLAVDDSSIVGTSQDRLLVAVRLQRNDSLPEDVSSRE